MKKRLTDRLVLSLPPPVSDQTICWDTPNAKGLDHTSGFGFRVTSGGARAYFLDYRNSNGRQRRITIGSPPAWTAAAARDQAAELRRRIDAGSDPLAELETERNAPTIRDLSERFERDELPKRRANTQYDYSAILRPAYSASARQVKGRSSLPRRYRKAASPNCRNGALPGKPDRRGLVANAQPGDQVAVAPG
jgi:hypothetical protein